MDQRMMWDCYGCCCCCCDCSAGFFMNLASAGVLWSGV